MDGRVITKQGNDRTELFESEVLKAGIPLRLALACAWAESGQMNEAAERWGTHTADAKLAMANGDRGRLAVIITTAWADVSFGLCQRIVKYHWWGDHTASVDNVLDVRRMSLQDVARDVHEMCTWLASDYDRAETAKGADAENYAAHLGDDRELGALTIYNAGHWPLAEDAYWTTHGGNIDNYRRGLDYADAIIAEMEAAHGEPAPATEEGGPMTIEERKAQLQTGPDGEPLDRLGNDGAEYSPVCEWESSAGLMRFQQFWRAGILEYPCPTEADPNGRDCVTIPEGTLAAEDLARFRA